jgi:tetratricopeptide (TPR) repeat protein
MSIEIKAAIVLGVFTIVAAITGALISRSKKKEKRIEKKIEEPQIIQALHPIPEERALQQGIPTPPTPYFAHPYPLQENFTGREVERKELTEWFSKSDKPMFAYVAMGGMGKSALTWYWLHEDIIKKGLAPEGIIWWSFYDKEARFETFLMKAIQYASEGKIDAKEIPSTRDRMDALYKFLYEKRFLLILDGVERVLRAYAGLGSPYQGDEVKKDEQKDYLKCIEPNVGTFLQWLAGQDIKTKTLLTSRLCPKEMDDIAGCFHKDLKELPKEDAVEFYQCQGVKGTRAEIENACEQYGYHPLSLRLLSGMIVKDPKHQGDIVPWSKYNPLPELKGEKKEHLILELAYNSLDPQKQVLISKLSAFRNPMEYDSIVIFNEFKTEKEFDDALIELVDRELLLRDTESNKYDLHPIVKKYFYDRLKDKTGVHSRLRDYFASVPKPEKIESLDDLAPVIELYHHTANSEKYEEAFDLLYEKLLPYPLYFQLCEYQLAIDLLLALFPDSEDKLPRLINISSQAWTLNSLANNYTRSGLLRKAIKVFEKAIDLTEEADDKWNLAIYLGNLVSTAQIPLGDFESAVININRRINLFREMNCEFEEAIGYREFEEAIGHREFGRLLMYKGKFQESLRELNIAERLFGNLTGRLDVAQSKGVVWAYYALLALLLFDVKQALKAATEARKLADVQLYEQDIIRAEWLLGASYLAKGDLKEAEEHLNEALVRDRRINLVDLEPDILLELAKLRFVRVNKVEALKLANEALGIADRSEYRLKQADIHNFLAEFYIDAKDFDKAKEHIKIAKERAECGYKPAMDKAEKLDKLLEEENKKV